MTDPRFEDRRYGPADSYGRWRSNWNSDDNWGVIAAVVVTLFIVAGLIFYGSRNTDTAALPSDATTGQATRPLNNPMPNPNPMPPATPAPSPRP